MKLSKILSASCLILSASAFGLFTAHTAYAQNSATLQVATDATFMPMEYTENGTRKGFDIDIMNALATAMGKKVQWTDIDFKGLIPGLIAHRFDIAISAIYITPERAKVVGLTDPYFSGGLVAIVKKDSPVKSLADLDGKKVSVQVGTKSVSYLQANYPKVSTVEVEKNQEMFDLVGIGRVDAAVTGKPAAYQFARTRPGFRVLDQQITTEAYGIAVRQDEPALKDELNVAIKKIKADGTYAAIVDKWFPASHNGTSVAP
jgi:polar amino acid transport system substrate-binding protein